MTFVEGKDAEYRIDLHDSHQVGIMGLLAADRLGHHDLLPCPRNFGRIGQQRKKSCTSFSSLNGLGHGQAQAVLRRQPCGHGPEFHQILRRNAQRLVTKTQLGQGAFSRGVMRVLRMNGTQKDVGIGQNHRYRPRSA